MISENKIQEKRILQLSSRSTAYFKSAHYIQWPVGHDKPSSYWFKNIDHVKKMHPDCIVFSEEDSLAVISHNAAGPGGIKLSVSELAQCYYGNLEYEHFHRLHGKVLLSYGES